MLTRLMTRDDSMRLFTDTAVPENQAKQETAVSRPLRFAITILFRGRGERDKSHCASAE
ncbi:hypothetical protein BDK62_10136 [Halomonas alkaliantarctica]|nr:hypothetical protein BDK62_10136 [Halomonas alkaliantarctica]